jgi:hypothetical protein
MTNKVVSRSSGDSATQVFGIRQSNHRAKLPELGAALTTQCTWFLTRTALANGHRIQANDGTFSSTSATAYCTITSVMSLDA